MANTTIVIASSLDKTGEKRTSLVMDTDTNLLYFIDDDGTQTGIFNQLNISGVPDYTDLAGATAAGLVSGDIFRCGSATQSGNLSIVP